MNKKTGNIIINSDVLNVLSILPRECVDLTVTSPPYYNVREYSFYENYKEYLSFLEEVFSGVYKITKEGRFLVVNTSPVIIPRKSRSHQSKRYGIPFDLHNILIKIGWDFIDDIVWIKPDGASKNRIGGFLRHRKPLGYKPNPVTEYVMVYRKKTEHLIDWNMKQHDEKTVASSKVLGEIDRTNVWKISPARDKVHSAVFPEELSDKIIKYYSYKGDWVFDPFGGSGTTLISALKHGRYCLMTEINNIYFERIKQRVTSYHKNTYKCMFYTLNEFKEVLDEG